MDIVKIENYSFAYPDGRKALKGISLSIEQGSFNVLCGRSGCGKSTLLKQLKNSLRPHGMRKGKILFDGMELSEMSLRDESSRIGFVMQDPDSQIVTDKVWHELAFGLESLGCDKEAIRLRVAEMASYFGIQGWFHKNVEELSGGQKQLLNLAAIMAMHPTLLILDEPTSQLDPIAAGDFISTLHKINRELGITILMTEHRLEEVMPIADRVMVMEEGRIITDGTPKETGLWLYENNHEMYSAMPAPFRIYAEANKESMKKPPLTVRDGRSWLDAYIKGNKRLSSGKFALHKLDDDAVKEDILKAGVLKRYREDKAEISADTSLKDRIGNKFFKSDDSLENIIELKDVWFRYERDFPDVVKGASLGIKKGEIYCLLGGNGTGKSTTMSLISRVQKPYRGKIYIGGKDIRKYSSRELYRSWLGVVPQNPQSLFAYKTVRLELYEMIGGEKEIISEEYPIDFEKKAAVEKMAELMGIDHLLEQHPYDLSGGEQQRLAIAKILLLRPKILLLDEPTKGLDAAYKETLAGILKKLKAHGITVFMISHDIEFCAEHGDRCGMFFDGAVVTENTPKKFFAGNSFYTTASNRMARHIWPDAVTAGDVIRRLTCDDRTAFDKGSGAEEVCNG